MRLTTYRRFALLGVMLVGTVAPADVDAADTADVIVNGATVYTMDSSGSTAEAVAIRGERILFVGSIAEAQKYRSESTRVLGPEDGESIVLPGLVDAHGHMMNLGRKLRTIDLVGTTSVADVRSLVEAKIQATAPGEWIWGRGWDQNDWAVKEFPTWRDLAGTESNPVYLRRVDGHASLLNRTAMEALGIDRTTSDPAGGRIIRDAEGEPTGVLIDKADDWCRAQIPQPALEERVERIRSAVRECNRNGVTGVHDAGTQEDHLDIYRRLYDAGELSLRVYCMFDTDQREFTRRMLLDGPRSEAGGRIEIRAIKLYADGALGSRGAVLLEPYTDDPANSGLLQNSRETLVDWATMAVSHGFQTCTHAIGDGANRLVLDVYEEVLSGHDAAERRWRIEHAQVISPDDVERFARHGIIASMQPTHCTSDMYWAEDRIGPVRLKGAYAWRMLMDSGCVIACGSDFPVESVNPLLGIYAAVTRQDPEGWPEGGWYPDQRMTVEEAVLGFTRNAAFAGFAEGDRGTIEAGKLADLVVLSRDIFRGAPERILDTRVLFTIVGGDVVYQAAD